MAEATKKPKAPRKTKSAAKPELVTKTAPAHEEIAELAHRFWLERGGHSGDPHQDWLRAEETLRGKAS